MTGDFGEYGRPTAAELVAAVAEFLDTDVRASTDGRVNFHARLAAEALRIVAREAPNPVGSEFHNLVESTKVGVTMEQALKRMMESMPTPEVGFFAIVMTIQGKSGGNLSEALGNLASVLRDRKRLQGKIKAMSSEAKASAGIIGSLPFVVGILVTLTTPSYMVPLFTTTIGLIWLGIAVILMSIGGFMMNRMIQFDF